MSERIPMILRLACLLLAATLLLELSSAFARHRPLAKVRIPELPVWPGTNTTQTTNGTGAASGAKTGTNNAVTARTKEAGTNAAPGNSTNRNAGSTNPPAGDPPKPSGTNPTPMAGSPPATNLLATAASRPGGHSRPRNGRGGPGGSLPGLGPDVPPEIKAWVERIYQSELFGPVNHPVPSALMGIAGDQVFVRASNGQTGPVKVGEELGGLKILKIAQNRVLVEEEGQEKELTIFSGFGSESLMTQKKEKSQ